jgi:uncharacterized protein YbjT (DUF2867 family)
MGDSVAKVALIAGASGLVGGHLLEALLDAPDFARVYAVTRRAVGRDHPKLANRIVQFERLEEQLRGLTCHTAFCCLGPRAGEARSEQELRRFELGYVVAFARVAKAANAQRLVLLSCAGAAAARSMSMRVKAEAERTLEGLGFASLDILQPGPLLGLRRETSLRDLVRTFGMPLLNPLLTGARESLRGISARTVARAMLGASRSGRRGVQRYAYAAIGTLANAKALPRAAPAAKSAPRRRGN